MPSPRPSATRRASEKSEQEAAQRLALNLAPRIDALVERQENPDSQVLPGSPLARDDALTHPFQLSHVAWHGIGHAVDSLHALRTLIVRGDEANPFVYTHPYAAYPMIRAALENASQCIWLLGPKNRNVRLTRRFRLLLTDAFNLDKVAGLTRLGPGDTRESRLGQILPVVADRGLDRKECERPVGNAASVRGAAEIVNGDPDSAEAIWRALSGLSHGDMWSLFAAIDRDEVAVSVDGTVVTLRTTSSVTNVANLTAVAVATTEAALRIYDRRRTPTYS